MCQRLGCLKPSFNGRRGKFCSKRCRQADKDDSAAFAALCSRVGCFNPICSLTCRNLGASQQIAEGPAAAMHGTVDVHTRPSDMQSGSRSAICAFREEELPSPRSAWTTFEAALEEQKEVSVVTDAKSLPSWASHVVTNPSGALDLDPLIPTRRYQPSARSNNILSLWKGDITKLRIAGIVNAANSGLLRGGGVCGAIHEAAGPELAEECDAIGFCAEGQTVLTRGYGLPALHVLHTVAPMTSSPDLLRSCYTTILETAEKHSIRTLAICCIGTGIFGYPAEPAAHIALGAIRQWLDLTPHNFDRIVLVMFRPEDLALYERLMRYYFPQDNDQTTQMPLPGSSALQARSNAVLRVPESIPESKAVWQWRQDEGSWEEYSEEHCAELEKAYQEKLRSCIVQTRAGGYKVDFSLMMQCRESGHRYRREVRRKLNQGGHAGSEDETCVVCLVCERSHAFVPCGHLCVCSNCADSLNTTLLQPACPLCRCRSTAVIKIMT